LLTVTIPALKGRAKFSRRYAPSETLQASADRAIFLQQSTALGTYVYSRAVHIYQNAGGKAILSFHSREIPKAASESINIPRLTARVANLELVTFGLFIIVVKLAVKAVRLQVLAGFKTNRLAGRNRHLLARARVATDAPLARLNYENAKATQFDPVPARQGILHRLEQCFDSLFGFEFRDSGFVGETIDDIEFDHSAASEC
jgi:hypothetical protein